jgi:hypothetical protein
MRFYEIPEDAFKSMTTETGILLDDFDPANPEFTNDNILTATTGGIQIVTTPTYSDLGEDVDNCPNNMMEFKKLEGWDVSIVFTALEASRALMKLGLGAADINDAEGSVTLRKELKLSDFLPKVWWACDKAGGGFVAACLMNALSTEGFTLQTGKNAKGTSQITLKGHVSIKAQSTMPLKYYSIDSETVLETETFAGDGETTAFTLGHNATAVLSVLVGGATIPSDAWSYSELSSTVTFTTAPADGANIRITYRYVPEV